MTVEELMSRLRLSASSVEGLTVSGGEPFAQPEGLLHLVKNFRVETGFTTILFSGHTLAEILATERGPAILEQVDVLISGRYDRTKARPSGIVSTANQELHLLTDRYSASDFASLPTTEIRMETDGRLVVTGICPVL